MKGVWGKETRFGLQLRGGVGSRAEASGPRILEASRSDPTRVAPDAGTGDGFDRCAGAVGGGTSATPSGFVASMRSMRWGQGGGARGAGRRRCRGRAERLGTGSGGEATRGSAATAAGGLSRSASTWPAAPCSASPLGSAASGSRPPPIPERSSPPSMLCAWARRNSDQLGPIPRGAGPRPEARNTVAIVVAETLIPSFKSSPWMHM